MSDLISRQDAIDALGDEPEVWNDTDAEWAERDSWVLHKVAIESLPSAEADTDCDMGEVSDGYHTFNQLYHQRAVLFATIVKQNKEKAWKSWKHGDGKFCFDSNKEWFIVGVDTPEGSYTYHYEKKCWDMFDCIELEHGKFWDGHTEEDVTRLLSLPSADRPTKHTLPDGTEIPIDEESYEIGYTYGQMADRPTGWIPVSERLPEDIKPVIITWKNTDPASYYQYIVGKHFIGTGHYCNGKWFWYSSVCEDLLAEYGKSDIDELDEAIEVIAWMPLPEPYKGGDDE